MDPAWFPALRDTKLRRTTWPLIEPHRGTLTLNVEDLDLEFRRARVVSKGDAIAYVHWATPTARLLPRLLADRTTGPLFLADRRAPSSGPRTPAAADIDPTTGRGRLSYPRAEYLFKTASTQLDPHRPGWTLHQLRQAVITMPSAAWWK
ncbi:hypothetical protein [Nonomuraea sp. LPB2021202275-12-8]|uniref:hypothetical protein n=1 Tax=Nonomuraea sp. LPB2021202275-12-8 TaxID=3120159 RepID=UPI00300DBB83